MESSTLWASALVSRHCHSEILFSCTSALITIFLWYTWLVRMLVLLFFITECEILEGFVFYLQGSLKWDCPWCWFPTSDTIMNTYSEFLSASCPSEGMRHTVSKTKYSYLKNNGELLSWFLLGKVIPWLCVCKHCLQFLLRTRDTQDHKPILNLCSCSLDRPCSCSVITCSS